MPAPSVVTATGYSPIWPWTTPAEMKAPERVSSGIFFQRYADEVDPIESISGSPKKDYRPSLALKFRDDRFSRRLKALYWPGSNLVLNPTMVRQGPTPGLQSHALSLMTPPSHYPHEERTPVAKGVSVAINSPVMNQTGIPDGSTGNQNRYPSHFVIDHFSLIKAPYRISPALAIYLQPNDQCADLELRVSVRHELWFIYRLDFVPR